MKPPSTPSPPRRRHTEAFKRAVCEEIRSGRIGRREAQWLYRLSDNLLQRWLAAFGDQQRSTASSETEADVHEPCRRRMALLEQRIGQLTMALEEREKRPVTPPQRRY